MRWIYLSPHMDDASLSAGGLIYDQTHADITVEIWTIMCGYPSANEGLSPFAESLHKKWATNSAQDTINSRRAENEISARILGANTLYFEFLDCIYRHDEKGEWLYDSVFLPPNPSDAKLPEEIMQAISKRLMPDDVLVCQFALGSHVDHVLVRSAAEMLKLPLYYLADIPYLFNHPDTLAPNTKNMKKSSLRVSEAGLSTWKEAIAAYSSQISTLFDSIEDMHASIESYTMENDGVRLWQIDR